MERGLGIQIGQVMEVFLEIFKVLFLVLLLISYNLIISNSIDAEVMTVIKAIEIASYIKEWRHAYLVGGRFCVGTYLHSYFSSCNLEVSGRIGRLVIQYFSNVFLVFSHISRW